MTAPLVLLGADRRDGRHTLKSEYVQAVLAAGALPLILPTGVPPEEALQRADAIVLTGGGDPDMSAFGVAMHPEAIAVAPERQAADLALLRALDEQPRMPVLGVCLGMQLMGLHAGGALHQHLDEVLPQAERHRGDREHPIVGELGQGMVTSEHHQALSDSGTLEVVARADDGTIEAIRDPSRPFALGVQWHPERTRDPVLGLGLFERLVASALAGRRE